MSTQGSRQAGNCQMIRHQTQPPRIPPPLLSNRKGLECISGDTIVIFVVRDEHEHKCTTSFRQTTRLDRALNVSTISKYANGILPPEKDDPRPSFPPLTGSLLALGSPPSHFMSSIHLPVPPYSSMPSSNSLADPLEPNDRPFDFILLSFFLLRGRSGGS